MRKWIILGIVALLFVVGTIFALNNLNSYLDENKDWLAQQAEAAIGRRVQFDEIGVSLRGGLGATVGNLAIADDATYSKGDFVRVRRVQVLVKVLPALFGSYEVRRIVLDAPEITVIETREGFNFDSIGKKPGAKAPTPPAARAQAEPEPENPGAAAALPLLVSTMSIRDGVVRFIDRTSTPPADVSIRQLDLTASDLSPTTPLRMEFSAAVLGAPEPNLTISGLVGPVGPALDPATLHVDLKMEFGPLVIDDLRQLKAVAAVLPPDLSSADPIRTKAVAKGTLDQLDLNASVDGSDAAIRYGSIFTKPKGVKLEVGIEARRAGTNVDIKKAVLRLASLDLSGRGRVTTAAPTSIDLDLDVNPSSLSGWDRLLPALQGVDVSGTLSADVHASGTVGGAKLPHLTGTLGLQNLRAGGKAVPVRIDGLTTTITFRGDSLELPPTTFKVAGLPVELQATAKEFSRPAASMILQAPELRLAALGLGGAGVRKDEVLRGLKLDAQTETTESGTNVQATLTSSGGSLRDIDYGDLSAELSTRDGLASVRRLSLHAFEGTFRGGAEYDMRRAEEPKFDARSEIRNMNLGLLLASQAPKAAGILDGRLDTDLTLNGSGKKWDRIKQTLRGGGRLEVKDGVLKDINIVDSALGSVTGIAGLSHLISARVRNKYPELFGTADTPFDELGATVKIADGRATTDDLTLRARDYAVRGAGFFTFDKSLDFAVTLTASDKLTQDIIADAKEARYLTGTTGRVEIPFRLKGTLPKVRPQPDTDFIAKALQRALVEKGVDEILKRKGGPGRPPGKKSPTEELLQKGLEGLLGR